MRAVLYTIYYDSRWNWRVSLDLTLHADKLFWLEHKGMAAMFRVVRDLPFGQAAALSLTLDKQCGEEGVSPERQLGAWAKSMPVCRVSAESSGNDDGFGLLLEDAAFWDKLAASFHGRSLLWEEMVNLLEYMDVEDAGKHWRMVVQWAYLTGIVELDASVQVSDKHRFFGLGKQVTAACRRCGNYGESIVWTECASCGETCPYCEACLNMGRARYCSPLISGRKGMNRRRHTVVRDVGAGVDELEDTIPVMPVEDWRLSPAQLEASEAAIRFLLGKESADKPFLIWAVTGAGKTEMIFPLVATELLRNGKVLIATPRRDVVLELLPRLKAAFPAQNVIALYGGSAQRWETGDITVATTHQLLRFEGAFDLVIIDEIDAFPFHNNPVLEYAARKACTPGGAFVLLSATPPEHLQSAAMKGRIPNVMVPVRYHGKPLPQPKLVRYGGLHTLQRSDRGEQRSPWLLPSGGNGKLPEILAGSLQREAQVFVFVPRISRLEQALAWMRRELARVCAYGQIEATSSQDMARHEKVKRFRDGEIRILLTTTILERGVTIPKADVVVLDADSALFDAAALVQMAGRAGRSAADPFGTVHFLAQDHNRSQAEAIRQIRAMNRLAKQRGYLV